MTTRQRRCIVTGDVKQAAELVRFVVAPDGAVVPDVAGDLPGRGLWLSASRQAVDTACAKRLFAKAARRRVTVAEDLAARTEALLARRCLDVLGLARRAGQATLGFEQVRALLKARKAAVLIAARDGGADGRAKTRKYAAGVAVIELFTSAELSLALGRENVVHAALAPGGIADRFVAEAARFAGFRAGAVPEGANSAERQ